MDHIRNRSLLFATACLIGVASVGTACSASTEVRASGGDEVPSSDRSTTTTSGTGVPGPTAAAGATGTTASTYLVSQSEVATAGGGAAPETTIADPNETYPPPPVTEQPTIPASGDDPVLIDCGILYRASGWPTTFVPNLDAFTCLEAAFDSGTPARLVDREQTDGYGGAILVTTYDVLGPGRVRVNVDAREAADRPPGITVSECTGLVVVPMTITPSSCTVVSS